MRPLAAVINARLNVPHPFHALSLPSSANQPARASHTAVPKPPQKRSESGAFGALLGTLIGPPKGVIEASQRRPFY